ncbi:GT2 family glycosyltransferase [Actimicrobium sp. GrIS 1.19]|nr:GT2 family glycosyltransferase [Actimicrobium sp. GrIS 1.19]
MRSLSDKVSVIVVNWNGEAFLERCLNALLAQTIPPHEILVVDNASADASLELLGRFPTIRLLAQTENTGFARGNNLALRAASPQSTWVALMNPDAFADPGWLAALLAATVAYPDVDAFGSKLLKAHDATVLDGIGDVYHLSGLVWRSGHGMPATDDADAPTEIFAACAAAALYRRSVLDQLGGFDEDYFCYVEDVDLGFRLRLAGYRCFHVPQSVVHHVGSGTTGGQHSEFAIYHGHRNLVWTFIKDMPGPLFWLFLPLHLLLNLGTVIWFAWQGRGAVILRAKRDALLGVPAAWRKRRQIQRARVASIASIWRMLDRRLRLTKANRTEP